MQGRLAVVIVATLARTAAADGDADALTSQGEELARIGEYSRAIDLFKRADAMKPSVHRACLIGLAYTRRELWSEAEIFFDRCKQGASTADPLPEWFAEASAQLEQKLHAADVGEVDIRVVPESAGALLSISSFPPDETFVPRKLHLVGGTYDLTVTATGYRTVHRAVTPKAGTSTVVVVTLVPKTEPAPSRAPWFWAAAGALAIGGGVFHVLAVREGNQLRRAADANDPDAWDAHSTLFTHDRTLAIGCYGVAAIAATVGVVLHLRHHDSVEPQVSIGGGGAMIGLEVRR